MPAAVFPSPDQRVFAVTKPASAQFARSSLLPSPASVATRLRILEPGGIATSNRQGSAEIRITGLEETSLPSRNTLKTTLGYLARFEPFAVRRIFSSTPASATNR